MENKIQTWLSTLIGETDIPLFQCASGLRVSTRQKGTRTLVNRSAEMEAMVIRECDKIRKDIDEYEGLLTIAYLRIGQAIRPFFATATEALGRGGTISRNLSDTKATNRSKNFFARWGDDVARHIGQLSDAMFPKNGKTPTKVKLRWIEQLFTKDSGDYYLKHPAYFVCVAWKFTDTDYTGGHTYLTDLSKAIQAEGKQPKQYWAGLKNALKKIVGCLI